jgi:YidC/Oxa1 family membrane protein insertase
VDLYSFAPIAAILDAAYLFLSSLVSLIQPIAGNFSAAVAIVLLTVVVRAALVPVGISQVRAERTRRRLAPALNNLRRRYSADPAQLQKKTMELYSSENASPLAGCLPLLLQVPVLSIVYGLFILGSINGHGNALLNETLGGIPLGSSVVTAISAGLSWQAVVVSGGLLAVVTIVAALARRTALAQSALDAEILARTAPGSRDAAQSPARATQGTPQISERVTALLSWAPFITVLVAMFVPLAAAIYLAVTTCWTLAERSLLRAHLR